MPRETPKTQKTHYGFSTAGNNCVLMALHGSGADHTTWPAGLRTLPGAKVYALDLPGHGKSAGPGRCRVEDYADWVEDFAQRLNLQGVTLAGHSLGGAIAQVLALRSPRWLSRIVLVGTGARLRVAPEILEGLTSRFEATVDLICRWSFGPTAGEEIIRPQRERLLRTAPQVIHGDYAACNQFDIMGSVARIRLPTLVIAGTADRMTPLQYGQYLADQIPGAQIAIIEDGGHMMALEKPEKLIESIRAFMGIGPT